MRGQGAPGTFELSATSFVGRARDLSALADLVRGSALVTVLGPPGTGKTRIVKQFVLQQSEPPTEACFCDLTDATSAVDICSALARALHVPLTGAGHGESTGVRETSAQLAGALASRGPLLVVLDNFEQVVGDAAATVGEWLRAAPRARFLVTSRQRLGLEGEVLFDLGPLPLPRAGLPATESEAVQLFVERARSVRRGYELGEEDAPVVAELVRELDGLSLAIELCAARVRVLSPAQLLRDLPRRFQLLAPGASAGGRGLEDAIDSSWELLSTTERAALASLSVFRGGMTPSAAEAVMDLSGSDGAAIWPLDVLQALVDRSLVHSYEIPELAGERRFALFVSIREYAANKLRASGHEARAMRRHAAYFLESFRAWTARVESGAAGEAARRLALERENLLAVHRRAVARDGDLGAADALEAALALSQLINAQGPFGLAVSLLDTALQMPGAAAATPALRARVLEAMGSMRSLLGDTSAGATACTEALAIAHELADRRLEASILGKLGSIRLSQGRWREARAHHESALEIHRSIGDRRSLGFALIALGHTYFYEDDLAASSKYYEEALAIHRELGDRTSEGIALSRLASVHMQQGRREEARTLYEHALAIHTEVKDLKSEGSTAGYLAILEQEQGRLAEARALYEHSLGVSRAVGNRRVEGIFLGYLGNCQVDEGLLDEAVASYAEAVRVLRAAGSPSSEALFHGCLGAALAELGRVEEAATALDAAEEQLARMPEQSIFATAVAIHRGHLDLALARGGDAAAHHARAERRLGDAPRQDRIETDVRFARRFLTRSLDLAPRDPAPPTQRPLVVATSGRWFQPPSGDRVRLDRRRALRLVLEALALQRGAAPGEAISLETVVAAGWPGQRLHPEAAAERAYTAIATLRRLGLKDILQTRDDGYLLDPKVPFEPGGDD